MRIDPRWTGLVVGSKVGVGVQGESDPATIDRIADRVLLLSPDRRYAAHFGPRTILRVYHAGDEWRALDTYTEKCLREIRYVYGAGVRDVVTLNEPNLRSEGGGPTEADYRFLDDWGARHVGQLRSALQAEGKGDVRIWGGALSPQPDADEHFGLLARYLAACDGLVAHCYWQAGRGFLDDPDAGDFSLRLLRWRRTALGLGIDRPWLIGECNRSVVTASPADVTAYAWQLERYFQWASAQSWIVAVCVFIATSTDPAFEQYTLTRMPGMVDRLAQCDRLAELPGAAESTGAQATRPSFAALAERLGADWEYLNPATQDGSGDWVQDVRERSRSKQYYLLREYAAEPGRVYLYRLVKQYRGHPA